MMYYRYLIEGSVMDNCHISAVAHKRLDRFIKTAGDRGSPLETLALKH